MTNKKYHKSTAGSDILIFIKSKYNTNFQKKNRRDKAQNAQISVIIGLLTSTFTHVERFFNLFQVPE